MPQYQYFTSEQQRYLEFAMQKDAINEKKNEIDVGIVMTILPRLAIARR